LYSWLKKQERNVNKYFSLHKWSNLFWRDNHKYQILYYLNFYIPYSGGTIGRARALSRAGPPPSYPQCVRSSKCRRLFWKRYWRRISPFFQIFFFFFLFLRAGGFGEGRGFLSAIAFFITTLFPLSHFPLYITLRLSPLHGCQIITELWKGLIWPSTKSGYET